MKCENFSFFHHFFLEKVCGFEKKVVPLHPLSPQKQVLATKKSVL